MIGEKGTGRINPAGAATEGYWLMRDGAQTPAERRRAVLSVHGRNGTATSNLSDWSYPALTAVATCGLPFLQCDFGGPLTFWNDTALARLHEAVLWLEARWALTDGVVLLGHSMGSGLALTYAADHPEHVAALALAWPATDLEYLHANGYGAEIDAAYGSNANYLAALPGHDPKQRAATGDLDGVSITGLVSSDDTTVGVDSWDAFLGDFVGSPTPETYELGAVGHGDPADVPTSVVMAAVASAV